MIENPKQFQEILDSTDQTNLRFADWLKSSHLKTLQEIYRHQIDTEVISLMAVKDHYTPEQRATKERAVVGMTFFTGRLTTMLDWLTKKSVEPQEPNRKYNNRD